MIYFKSPLKSKYSNQINNSYQSNRPPSAILRKDKGCQLSRNVVAGSKDLISKDDTLEKLLLLLFILENTCDSDLRDKQI